MSFEGLQERLSALQNTISQTRDLIDKLTDLEFQPGSAPPLINSAATTAGKESAGGLSAEVGQLLREAQDERRQLLEEVELVGGLDGHDRSRLEEGLDRTGNDLERCRVDFRLAKLSARKESFQAHRQERQQFVQTFSLPTESAFPDDWSPDSAPSPAPHQPPRHHHHYQTQKAQQVSSLSEQDRQTVGASSRATEALREMHASLQSELERSEYANETMTESSAAFGRLSESYGSLETMLGSSRDLLGALLRSQKSDTWYLQSALYMLLAALGWLAFRRFLYGPLWWFAWMPLRILFGVGSRVGSAVVQERQKGEGVQQPGSVGTDGRVSVDGLPGEELPTAQVGQDNGEVIDEPGSMAEQVGKIIDKVQEADVEGLLPEEPRHEGETVHDGLGTEDTRPRDEL